MKHLLVALTIMLTCFTGYSQIEIVKPANRVEGSIGKVSAGYTMLAELKYEVPEGEDTLYKIFYRNAEYSRIVDMEALVFNSEDNALVTLYTLIKSVFEPENIKNKDYRMQIKLGDELVTIGNFRVMGNSYAMIQGKSGFFYLTERQLDKLFAKSK